MSIVEDILYRLRHRNRILGKGILDVLIVPATGEIIDSSVEEIKQKKINEWREKGVPQPMITHAIKLAEQYTQGMIEFITKDPEFQKQIMPKVFETALEKVSEPWIQGFLKAMT